MLLKEIDFTINVTNKCNLNCDYCIQTVRNNKQKYDINIQESIKYIDNFIKQNPIYEVIRIDFFGGEPTLKRKQIIEFLEKIKNKEYIDKIKFTMTTNAFIYFPEFFIFMKKNKIKNFEITISYDFSGQYKRSKNSIINNIIKSNIIKYKNLLISLDFDTYDKINIASCITEKNINFLYDYFLELSYNLNVGCFNITPVFPEYWKKESFIELNNQFKKIYNHIIETKNKKLKFLFFRFPYKDISSKHNTIQYGTNTLCFDKVNIEPGINSENIYYITKDRRGTIKKKLKIKKEIINILNNEYNFDFKLYELNMFKEYCINKDIFNFLTIFLCSGANIKRYKNEIYELFSYNIFLTKKYIKLIKKIRGNIKINLYNALEENGILYYLSISLSKESFLNLIKILKNNLIKIDFNSNSLNNKQFTIKYNNLTNSLGYFDKKDLFIYINKDKHIKNNINIQNTILHEIMHIYLYDTGIINIFEKEKQIILSELISENFIDIFKKYISNLEYISYC